MGASAHPPPESITTIQSLFYYLLIYQIFYCGDGH